MRTEGQELSGSMGMQVRPIRVPFAFTLNFNAIAAGTSKIEVTSQEIYDSNSQIVTVNQQEIPL